MVRHPQVVVREVTYGLPDRLAKGLMPQCFAVPRRLGVLKQPDAGIQSREGPCNVARSFRHAVADDKHFDLLHALRQRAGDRVAQRRAVIMRGNEDGRLHDRLGLAAASAMALSRAMTSTTSAPSAALLLGAGPPSR